MTSMFNPSMTPQNGARPQQLNANPAALSANGQSVMPMANTLSAETAPSSYNQNSQGGMPQPMQAPPMQQSYTPPGQTNPAMAANQATRGGQSRAQQLGMGSGQPGGGVAGGSMGGAPQFDQFREYQDAAYADRMRTLEPQLEQQSAAMAQQLVNRGMQPGSEAYNAEMNRMQSAQSAAQDDAHFGAMQFGLGAQNQSFQQQNAMDQLANALAISRGNNATQMGISNNSLALGRERLGFDQDAFNQNFGEGQRQFGLNFGEGQRQFDSNDMYRNNNMDFGQMMALENLGYRDSRDAVGDSRYNDSLTMSLLGMMPGMGGGNVNVGGAYNTGQNSAYNNFQANNANYQGNMGGLGSLLSTGASLFGMSDERLKENIEPIGEVDGVMVHEFAYKGQPQRYRGVMAQEVMLTHPDAVAVHPSGYLMVDYAKLPVDMEAA